MPLLLTLGVIVPSCAALTPGRVNASVATPARGSCDTFTPDPVDDELAVGADDPPPEHAVEDVDEVDGVPSGVERIELGGGNAATAVAVHEITTAQTNSTPTRRRARWGPRY